MIEIYSVTDFGQINQGDLLVIEKDNGVKFIAVARQVLSKGKPTEACAEQHGLPGRSLTQPVSEKMRKP